MNEYGWRVTLNERHRTICCNGWIFHNPHQLFYFLFFIFKNANWMVWIWLWLWLWDRESTCKSWRVFFFFCRLDFLRSLFCFHFPSNGRLIQFFKRALWFACVTKPNNAMLTILIAVHFDPPLFLSIFLSILSFFHFFFWGKFGEDSFFCLS